MEHEVTTHLVGDTTESQKYTYAKNWNVACVTSAWVYKCIKLNACVDEAKYTLGGKPTPRKPPPSVKQSVLLSSHQKTGLVASRVYEFQKGGSFSLTTPSTVKGTPKRKREEKKQVYVDPSSVQAVQDDLAAEASALELVHQADYEPDPLDLVGETFYVEGMPDKRWLDFGKLILAAGAAHYWEFNQDVTHIVLSAQVTRAREKALKKDYPGM